MQTTTWQKFFFVQKLLKGCWRYVSNLYESEAHLLHILSKGYLEVEKLYLIFGPKKNNE